MFTLPIDALGQWVSGDLGGLTIYTDRHGRKVAYAEAPANQPPSQLQTTQRTRFRQAQAAWAATTQAVKDRYEELVNQASLALTGQNLWISVSLKHNTAALQTLQRQTGIAVPTPPLY